MADEPTDEDFDEELDGDLELDGDELDGDLELEGDDLVEGDAADDGDDEDDAEVDAALAARPKRDDDEDDDEDLNPDDVEADLDEILKDRIAAADEDDDDEEEVAPEPRSPADVAEGVTPKKANEFTCTGCFLLVTRGQFGPSGAMHCPVGEADCPAIALIESGKLDTVVKPAKKATTPVKRTPKSGSAKAPVAKKDAKSAGGTTKKATSKAVAKKSAPAKKPGRAK